MNPDGDDEIVAFYQRHPYPPPVADLAQDQAAWSDGRRRRVEHHRLWPAMPYRDDHSILVAGCGTSQAVRYAIRYPQARVVGIDVSTTSLDQSRVLAERHDLINLELRLLPVEAVDRLESSFDHIVCTGVLHHLAEPDVGLGALGRVLADKGVMSLMVYAPYGRTGISMIQDYCRLLGVRPEPDEIDELVASLRELPPGHPLGHLLRNTPDFEDGDALADALLNPRDRTYAVHEVLTFLKGAALRFGRWVRQASYVPSCGVMSQLPHGSRIAALPLVDQFVAMELFRGTMTRHSFIARHHDDTDDAIRFDRGRWQDYVPLRPHTAISVRHNLPDGAAAALLNSAHTDPDLVLFVDEVGKQLFDSIDGIRSIGDISADHRGFFEQLWWHDLIMIDGSATHPDPGE